MALIPTGQAPDDYRRKLAYKLMLEGTDASPVQHWAQGLARLGQGALGGYEMYQADEKDKATSAEEAAALAAVLNGGASMGAPQASMGAPGGTARPTTGKIYSNDEPSPLDPPSGEDRTRMMATILGESANQPAQGQNAVASVIRNRAVDGGYGGDTPSGVVTAKNQFEPWNTEGGRGKMAAMLANPALAAKADQAIAMAYGEGGQAPTDPTNGAMNFFAPKAQAALGRQAPAWDRPGQMIGDHKFIGGKPQPGQEPYQVAGPATAAPQAPLQAPTDPRRDQIIQFLKGTPAQQKIGKALASQYIQQQFKPVEKTNEIKNFEYGQKDPRFAETQKKSEFGVIGKDEFGQDQYGWRDARTREVTPYKPPQAQAGQPSVIPPAPPGVDPKVWREAHSKRATEEGMPASSDNASKLRNEVQGLPSYKNLAQAAPVYKSMMEAAGRDTRAADVNMIYGMAKIMDPGSVVRESEMTVAQAIATLPQQLQAAIKSQMTGDGRLTPEIRMAIMQEAQSRIGAYQGMFDQDAGMYRGIAQRNRMNEADVLPTFGPFESFKPAAPPPAAATMTGPKKTKSGVSWSVE
jgi:spore germination cell wall hydrolase CwlJ-like protein